MSANNSNLSSTGYDMAVGLTQNSMNSTMKQYLNAAGTNPDSELQPVYYIYTDDSLTETVQISSEDLMALTGGVDPFSIPNGTTSSTTGDANAVAAGQALFDAYFAFGFKATMGLPDGVSPSHLPDIITLQDGTAYQEVNYNMYFKNFQIVQQTDGRSSWSYENLQQPADAPWVFSWIVNLNLESADFNNLPQDTQDSIKNLDSSSMFSVQQLLLDLSTPAMGATQPTISGLDTSSDAYNILTEDFIKKYWASLQVNGGVVFSYAIQPQASQPNPAEPSLIPTDLDFIVTPYPYNRSESIAPTSEEQGLYTLNYLVMANDDAMPSPVYPMSWDWLDSDEDKQYDGVMAIKKEEFVSYLTSLLNPCMADICVQPTVEMEMDGIAKVHYSWGHKTPSPMPTYQLVSNSNDPTHILTCYYKSDDAYDQVFLQGDITIWSSTQSDIYLSGNTISCITTAAVYLSVGIAGIAGVDLSHTKGYIYANKNTTTLTLGVTNDGVLNVTMDATNQDVTQDSNDDGAYYDGDLDASWFAEMMTLGDIDDLVSSIQDYYSDHMNSYMANYDSDLLNLLNNLQAWVFPGAQTFLYDKCCFSDNQDLTTMISYADPS